MPNLRLNGVRQSSVNTTIIEEATVSQHMLGLSPGWLLPHSVNTIVLVSEADRLFHGWCLLSGIRLEAGGQSDPSAHTGLYLHNLVGIPTKSSGQSMMSAEKKREGAEHGFSLKLFPELVCSLTSLSVCILPQLKLS